MFTFDFSLTSSYFIHPSIHQEIISTEIISNYKACAPLSLKFEAYVEL